MFVILISWPLSDKVSAPSLHCNSSKIRQQMDISNLEYRAIIREYAKRKGWDMDSLSTFVTRFLYTMRLMSPGQFTWPGLRTLARP